MKSKPIQELVEKIKQIFPLYQPVHYEGGQYVFMGVEHHGTIDRLAQIDLVSIRVVDRIDNQPQGFKFLKFFINIMNMKVVKVSFDEYPGHFDRSLDLEKNVMSILNNEGVIY